MKNPEVLPLGSTLVHGMPQQSVIDLPKKSKSSLSDAKATTKAKAEAITKYMVIHYIYV